LAFLMRTWIRLPLLAAGLMAAVLASIAPGLAGPSIVVDVGTGKVLSQEDAFRRWYPASLTKMITAYVVFDAIRSGEISLKSPVRISANAAKEPPSKMGYKPGSVLTIDNAMKILMVKSANDVATAVAESVGGSEQAFAARMNAAAARLGMTGSHFVNAHGLHSPDHYSTARDLAVVAIALRREFPQYAGYFALEAISSGKKVMPNNNTLIGRFSGADGMKTGYTCAAGFNLAGTATRNGRTLVAIVIGELSTETRAEKAAELLTRGFATPGFSAPRLANLRPSGGALLRQATDMRPAICTEEARKARFGHRDEQGRLVIRSPYISELDRPRRVIAVGLGGATGTGGGGSAAVYANVPIPTPRPDYRPTLAQGG